MTKKRFYLEEIGDCFWLRDKKNCLISQNGETHLISLPFSSELCKIEGYLSELCDLLNKGWEATEAEDS